MNMRTLGQCARLWLACLATQSMFVALPASADVPVVPPESERLGGLDEGESGPTVAPIPPAPGSDADSGIAQGDGQKSLANGLYMSGSWTATYGTNNSSVALTLANIYNESYVRTTGTLRLSLWATTSYPARGQPFTGYRLANFTTFSPLLPRYYYYDIYRYSSMLVPPNGTYWIVLVLEEYDSIYCPAADRFCIEDSSVSYTQRTFGPPPPTSYGLTVSLTGTGTGSVVSTPAGINCGIDCTETYSTNTSVTLTAVASSGSRFTGWGGDCTGTGACVVTMSAARAVTANFSPLPATRGDVNNDGRADFFWRDAAGGLSWWQMNGPTITASNYFVVGSEWVVADVGDLNGDRKSDLIWRRSTDGATYLWTLDSQSPSGFFDLGILPPAEWTLVGSADLNGDGRSDIVWRRPSDGLLYVWLMNTSAIIGQASLGAVPVDWTVADLADMNGDGNADILFRHSGTGDGYVWFMNGTTIASHGAVAPGVTPYPTSWKLLGLGDFNGDGKADILWLEPSGTLWIWLMNGQSISGVGNIGVLPEPWSVRSIGDFNGDGKADLAFRDTFGNGTVWYLNGLAVSGTIVLPNPGGTWQVIAP